MQDTPIPPDASAYADARVLGRLLVVQTTLHVMPQLDGLGDFLCEGLRDVPGIRGATACTCGLFCSESSEQLLEKAECNLNQSFPDADPAAVRRLPFSTINGSHGWLLLLVDEPGRFAPYEPHVQNLANVVGTITENRRQQHQLVEGQRLLEQNVRERTQELARAQEDLALSRKLESIGRLAGGIAHDFNNLLTAILGYAELAEGLEASDATAECLREIRTAAERASALTRQLLTFARRQVVAAKPVVPNALVADLTALLRPLIGEHIRLVTQFDPAGWRVMLDPGQFGQVLTNLAVNARDAMPRGGSLTVTTENVTLGDDDARVAGVDAAGDYVVVSVADTGAGMSDEVRGRAFEPFYTTKPVGHGTGLGLSTCYGIVRQSGGQIRIDSAPGAGTVVTMYFPRTAEENVTELPLAAKDERLRGHETVLLAEDESAIRRMASSTLRAHGYRVIEATNGRDAVDVASSHAAPVDLLITDVVMPEMGGLELVDRLRAGGRHLRVLFVSGYPNTDGDLALPGDGFLAKPFVPQVLLRKVRELLDRGQP